MEKLIKYYKEYRSIIASYIGEATDWDKAHGKLAILENMVNKVEIRDSKNASFYIWIKEKFCKEILEERQRILKLSVKQKERSKNGGTKV